jgi:hypothetical protein
MDFVYESRLKTNEFCMQNSKRVLELKRQDIACFGLRRLEMPSLAMGNICKSGANRILLNFVYKIATRGWNAKTWFCLEA